MCKEFKGLRFKKAQDVVFHSVEQYSVLDEDGKEVGHVSLRGGLLTCEYPHKNRELVYHFSFNDEWKYSFADEAECDYYLRICAHCIRKRMDMGKEPAVEITLTKKELELLVWGYEMYLQKNDTYYNTVNYFEETEEFLKAGRERLKELHNMLDKMEYI